MHLRLWAEPPDDECEPYDCQQGAKESQYPHRAGCLCQRDGCVLGASGRQPRRHPDRGHLHAGGLLPRALRHDDELHAHDSVAHEGPRSHERLAPRLLDLRQALEAHRRALQGLDRSEGQHDQAPHVELRRSRGERRGVCREHHEGVQRLRPEGWTSPARHPRDPRRRHDDGGHVDLYRRLWRRCPHGEAPWSGRQRQHGHLSELRMGLARQHSHALQPCVLRRERQADPPRSGTRLVG